jgi:alpha-tubulin suppressor-like RCC1 family protein
VTLELEESWLSQWTPTFLGGGNSKNELRADGGLTRAEKWGPHNMERLMRKLTQDNVRFISVSAARDHLLAVTSKGRVFVHPITLNANSHGQLGTRKIRVLDSDPTLPEPSAVQVELIPKIQQDPVANWTRSSRPGDSGDITPPPENRPLAKLLYEVPALKGIGITQAVANDRSSYVLTKENGRVLTWGANEFG